MIKFAIFNHFPSLLANIYCSNNCGLFTTPCWEMLDQHCLLVKCWVKLVLYWMTVLGRQ